MALAWSVPMNEATFTSSQTDAAGRGHTLVASHEMTNDFLRFDSQTCPRLVRIWLPSPTSLKNLVKQLYARYPWHTFPPAHMVVVSFQIINFGTVNFHSLYSFTAWSSLDIKTPFCHFINFKIMLKVIQFRKSRFVNKNCFPYMNLIEVGTHEWKGRSGRRERSNTRTWQALKRIKSE